ncbi:hypothetical protein K438DRAFT_1990402 [Mycena galopus ATCC 62051]|nr:hypothetical protein K438DRAFT_1990402 [Mycena galopus ATCC 62051]
MSEDESDLTDLEDELSEDDYAKKPKGGKGKSKVRGGKGNSKAGDYMLRGALTAPRGPGDDIQHRGAVQTDPQRRYLNPDYQRGCVAESKQIGIIDSILRNFYIPPVIFAVNGFDDASTGSSV